MRFNVVLICGEWKNLCAKLRGGDLAVNRGLFSISPTRAEKGDKDAYQLILTSVLWQKGDKINVTTDKTSYISLHNTIKIKPHKYFQDLYQEDFAKLPKSYIAAEHTGQIKNEDKIAREEKPKRNERLKKHMTNLDRYEKCSQNKIFNSNQAKSPILYSNACFNQNNIFDLISPGGHFSQKLVDTLKNMSEKFIFTWIELDIQNQECEKEQEKKDIKKLESELINCLGVNVFGIDSKYALSFTAFNSLEELKSVKWQDNLALEDRIKHINTESLNLKKSHCGCFK
jgi:hypothetical protein